MENLPSSFLLNGYTQTFVEFCGVETAPVRNVFYKTFFDSNEGKYYLYLRIGDKQCVVLFCFILIRKRFYDSNK